MKKLNILKGFLLVLVLKVCFVNLYGQTNTIYYHNFMGDSSRVDDGIGRCGNPYNRIKYEMAMFYSIPRPTRKHIRHIYLHTDNDTLDYKLSNYFYSCNINYCLGRILNNGRYIYFEGCSQFADYDSLKYATFYNIKFSEDFFIYFDETEDTLILEFSNIESIGNHHIYLFLRPEYQYNTYYEFHNYTNDTIFQIRDTMMNHNISGCINVIPPMQTTIIKNGEVVKEYDITQRENKLYINSYNNLNKDVYLYDLYGRQLLHTKTKEEEISIDLTPYEGRILLVKCIDENNNGKSKKIIIN